MGLGQSSSKEDAPPISSRFSSTELKKLEESFRPKETAISEDASEKWAFESVKACLSEAFNETISSRIISYVGRIAVEGEDVIPEQFLHVVYNLTKDSIKDLAETVFQIVSDGDETVQKSMMQKFFTEFVLSLPKGHDSSSNTGFLYDEESSSRFAEKLVQDFPDTMKEDAFDVALHRTPLLIDVLQHKFRLVFFDYTNEPNQATDAAMPTLIPTIELPKQQINPESFLLSTPSVMYINSKLPVKMQQKWRLLYSSKIHGESFSKMTGAMVGKGPTLVVIRDTSGYVFGGFASVTWEYSAQYQGCSKSFLFTAQPSLGVYDSTAGYNDHYMYLNIGQETMPNGLGMGGQHNFFGLWLDQEFGKGHSKAKPACTTYGSPQLSKEEEFRVDAVMIWGVGDEPKKDDEEYNETMTSVLDKHVEAKALLEIAGKPRVSEGLRDIEPDADIPETKELRHAHDPMT